MGKLVKKQMRKLDPYWHHGDYCRIPYWKHRANTTTYTESCQRGEKEMEGKEMLLHTRSVPSEN